MSYLKINIRIRNNFSETPTNKLDAAGPRAAHTSAKKIAEDTEPFVPARTKPLANANWTQVVGNKNIYPGRYARYLYYGKVTDFKDFGSLPHGV